MTLTARERLYRLVDKWDQQTQKSYSQSFRAALDLLFFHADLRYGDFIQYTEPDGPFPYRLERWILNVSSTREQQHMLLMACRIAFFDRVQMASLYRDAYRAIVTPILRTNFTPIDFVSDSYDNMLIAELHKFRMFSLTESFSFPEFYRTNSLGGLPKSLALTDNASVTNQVLTFDYNGLNGCLIFEDVVGTGQQAFRILKRALSVIPHDINVWFIPLIAFEKGLAVLNDPALNRICVIPALQILASECVPETADLKEPELNPYFRALVKKNAAEVTTPFDEFDEVPANAFGFEGTGALLVTCHNTPNNTLPLIHHKAPAWNPLFRRVHHTYPRRAKQ